MKLDFKRLKRAIELAECQGPLGSQSELFDKVANLYNSELDGITPDTQATKMTVYHAVRAGGLRVKTKTAKSGRPKKGSNQLLDYIKAIENAANRLEPDDETRKLIGDLRAKFKVG